MLGHMLLACPLLFQQGSREKVSFALQEAKACASKSVLAIYLCTCSQTSLGVALMAFRYICLFSMRPSINDQAKWSSHCSQAALIYHYSTLIGWISTSLPVREAGGEMSRDKQPISQIQSGVGEREKHRSKEWELRRKQKDKDTKGMREMKEW